MVKLEQLITLVKDPDVDIRYCEIVAEDAISFDGRTLPVVSDSGYTFKLLKTKIRAEDGARGLFRFLDEIAERGKFEKFPLFDGVYDTMAKKYGGG